MAKKWDAWNDKYYKFMNKKRIAVFGAHENTSQCYQQAKALGYYIVGIAKPFSSKCRVYCDSVYEVSFSDESSVFEICKKEKVDGITSFTLESAVPFISKIAARLGLIANSLGCVERIKTKYAQRLAFIEADGYKYTPHFQLLKEADDADICKVIYPCIVKPVDSGGSQGIFKVKNDKQLDDAIKQAKKKSRTHSVIIEDFIDGREFSVEYLSYKGRHYFCQLTDKVTSGEPLFVEIAHHQPADVSYELLERIKDTVESALTALKIENSPSHTEIKLNSRNELFIIEIGARMGGDLITSHLVSLSTGIDFLAATLNIACGTFVEPKPVLNKYAGVYLYSALTASLADYMHKRRTNKNIIEVNLEKEELDEVHSNADRSGYLLYQSEEGRVNLL